METLAFPLTIDRDGRLERTDPVSSLVAVLGAMAASPSGWAHAPWFGLQEAFVGAKLELEQQPALADALNRALDGLGVGWARVEAVAVKRDAPGERRFELTLKLADGRSAHRTLTA